MESQNRGIVRINGSGRVDGGAYQSVAVSGSGTIAGNVQADSIHISGSGNIEGSAKVRSFHASGSFRISGDLEAEDFHSSGSGAVEGSVRATRARSAGSLRIGGNLKSDLVSFAGAGTVNGNVEAEEFRGEGSVHIDGLLNADRIEIDVRGDSRVREIGGEKIRILSESESRSFLGIRWGTRRAVLEADSIEGDDVHIEGTRAAAVRGRRVKIGPGCSVESVEYTESLQIDPKARVTAYSCPGAASPSQQATIVSTKPVHRDVGTWSRSCRINIGGREVRNPILRFFAAIVGLMIAGVVVALVFITVFPAVAAIIGLVLGGVVLLLLLLAIGLPAFILVGIPVMIVLAILIRILLLPIDLVRWLLRLRRA